MNLEINIGSKSAKEQMLDSLRKRHNKANNTSYSLKEYMEIVWLPERISECLLVAEAEKREAVSLRNAYQNATQDVKSRVEELLGIQ